MFKNAVPLFSIFGFEVRVDPSWLLIATLIIWSLSGQYFPSVLPGQPTGTYLALGVLGMFGLFASLLLHELSHSMVAKGYGLRVGGITLFIFGGVAELTEEPRSAGSEFWIAIAGPAMSFVLSFLFAIAEVMSAGDETTPFSVLLGYLSYANLALAIFNLLPAFPMDGGRVLRAALWKRGGDLERATMISSRVGSVIGLGLIGLGILSMLSTASVGGFWLILIGFFIFSASRSTWQSMRIRSLLSGRKVREFMTAAPMTVDADMTLETLVHEVMLARNLSFLPVLQGGRLIGYVDKSLLQGRPREKWGTDTVGDIYVPVDADNTVSPGLPTERALEQLARSGRRKFLVAEKGQLLGVLSLADLMAYFALRDEIDA